MGIRAFLSTNLCKSIHFSFFLADETSSSSKDVGGIVLEEVLEEAPKWKVLRVS
jgi:hypothetical protein